MAVKFTSVAYYILQATKNKTTREKNRQREKKRQQKQILQWIIMASHNYPL